MILYTNVRTFNLVYLVNRGSFASTHNKVHLHHHNTNIRFYDESVYSTLGGYLLFFFFKTKLH